MEVKQRFTVAQPPEQVWAYMSDVRAVAECVPGLDVIEDRGGGTYLGRFAIKVGPLSAKLDGEGKLTRDDETLSAVVEGKGVDKRGGSRAKGTMRYQVIAAEEGSAVEVEAEVTLSGPLAQVGRSGIIEDVARSLTREFATNLEARLGERQPATTPPAAREPAAVAEPRPAAETRRAEEFDAGRAAWSAIWQRLVDAIKRLFGRA